MKIIKTISNNSHIKHNRLYKSRQYKGRIKGVFLREIITKSLVKTIGIDNSAQIGTKLTIIGFSGAFISFLFSSISEGLGRFFVYYPYDFYIFVFFAVMLLVGFFGFKSSVDYYKSTICEKCKRDFAYKEDCKPDIREIKTKNGTIKMSIIRTYKCINCGNQKSIFESKVIEPILYSDFV